MLLSLIHIFPKCKYRRDINTQPIIYGLSYQGEFHMTEKLIVKNLVKEYDGEQVLKSLSFVVKEGEFLSVLGPSAVSYTHLSPFSLIVTVICAVTVV